MANSTSISDFKEKVVKAICNDEAIFYAIDAKDCENGGDLIGTHIFKYNKNPNTIKETITFLTVMVHTKSRDRNGTYVTPTLELWIYTHYNHMDMDRRITKDNRNDYISILLDALFNGSSEYGGIGKLRLVSNTEGVAADKFLYRRLISETVDINDSFCNDWQ